MRQTTNLKAPQIAQISNSEVVANFPSESNPGRKPYETVLNRFSGRCICDCRGFASHKHCRHSEALVRLALTEQLVHTVKAARPRNAFTQGGKTFTVRSRHRNRGLPISEDVNHYAYIESPEEKAAAKQEETLEALSTVFAEVFPETEAERQAEEDALIAQYEAKDWGFAMMAEQVARYNCKSFGGGC